MRAVIQRVKGARVIQEGSVVGEIGRGLLVFLGVAGDDTAEDAYYLADKVVELRVFEDEAGKMNLSVRDVGGQILVVSQFTLLGDCSWGRRPSVSDAAPPHQAQGLYDLFVKRIREGGITAETGVFQSYMEVELINDGPVTLLLDSRKSL